jgi:hypothetical protein
MSIFVWNITTISYIRYMFKEGDKYIHFTKYGGVNKGEVQRYGQTMNHDYENEVVYVSTYIISTMGHVISLDGSDGRVYKVNEDMDPEMLKKLKSSTEVLVELKNRKQQSKVERIKEYLKDAKFKHEDGEIEPLSEALIKKINKQIDERSI